MVINMSYECNLQSNRIGVITLKNFYDYKLALNEATNRFEVKGKDGHIWGEGASTKGAMISALNCGIRLREIDIHDHYVPIREVIEVIKS